MVIQIAQVTHDGISLNALATSAETAGLISAHPFLFIDLRVRLRICV